MNRAERYAAAVELVRRFRERYEQTHADETRAAVWARSYFDIADKVNIRLDIDHEIERAGKCRTSFDALCLLADEYNRSGAPLPANLAQFLTAVASGRAARPARPGRPETKGGRDTQVALCVGFLVEMHGMTATLNEAYDPADRPSACHVVAEGWGLKYDTVAKVWEKRDKHLVQGIRDCYERLAGGQ